MAGLALVAGLVGINAGARTYAWRKAERLCSAVPAPGARFELEPSVADALREGATVVLYARDQTRLASLRAFVARLPAESRANVRVFPWRGGDSFEALWQPLYLARSTCTIEYADGVVAGKRADSMD